MNTIILHTVDNTTIYTNVNMLVFDMAGTTVNEGGIVYKTLYKTIKEFGIPISEHEIDEWHGANKYEVLTHFLTRHITDSNNNNININNLKKQIHSNFDNNLKLQYSNANNLSLINPDMPRRFNNIRKKGIKICLNTGFNKEIQSIIINKLNMTSFIDDFISSEEVTKSRPHPFMIQTLSKKHNIPLSAIIKFGDSKNDILEGQHSKCMASVGVLSGSDSYETLSKANPDMIIDSVMDIDIDNSFTSISETLE